MGDRVRVQLLVQENLSQYIIRHPGQLSLAIPAWVGSISIAKGRLMLCGWGVKAGTVRVWVAGKLCDPLANTGHI